jgi:hypothetical protein
MKKYILLTTLLLAALPLCAQENKETGKKHTIDLDEEFFHLPDSVTDEYLDNASLPEKSRINDYWIVGVHGGVSFEHGYYNPSRQVSFYHHMPVYGFSITRFATMMNTFPNLGMEIGFQHNYEGYYFKEFEVNAGTDRAFFTRSEIDGYQEAYMEVPEVFVLTHGHLDMGRYVKINIKGGVYAGYRMNITRIHDTSYDSPDNPPFDYTYAHSFMDTDNRWSYGIQGGLGLGLMLDPVEFHVGVQIKWGWSPFCPPDKYNQFSYRYAYPLDGAVTFGVYYQLTKRRGHTRSSLRSMARQYVKEELNPELEQ